MGGNFRYNLTCLLSFINWSDLPTFIWQFSGRVKSRNQASWLSFVCSFLLLPFWYYSLIKSFWPGTEVWGSWKGVCWITEWERDAEWSVLSRWNVWRREQGGEPRLLWCQLNEGGEHRILRKARLELKRSLLFFQPLVSAANLKRRKSRPHFYRKELSILGEAQIPFAMSKVLLSPGPAVFIASPLSAFASCLSFELLKIAFQKRVLTTFFWH